MQTSPPPFTVQESHTHSSAAKESKEEHGVKRHAKLSMWPSQTYKQLSPKYEERQSIENRGSGYWFARTWLVVRAQGLVSRAKGWSHEERFCDEFSFCLMCAIHIFFRVW